MSVCPELNLSTCQKWLCENNSMVNVVKVVGFWREHPMDILRLLEMHGNATSGTRHGMFTFCVRHGMASIPWHEGTAKVFFESVGAGMQKTMLIASNSTRENWLMLWNQVTKVRNFLQSSFLRFLLLPETTDIRKLGKLALFTAIWIETTTVCMYKCQFQRETNHLHRWFQDTLSYEY